MKPETRAELEDQALDLIALHFMDVHPYRAMLVLSLAYQVLLERLKEHPELSGESGLDDPDGELPLS